MGLTSIRADDTRMGGLSYIAQNGVDANWGVPNSGNRLQIAYEDKNGQLQTIEVFGREGDDIEQFATYLNGQTDAISASVSENGELQVFVPENEILEGKNLYFYGALAHELGLSPNSELRATVQDIDVTTVGGSQNAISIVDSALKYIDSQRASLGALQNRFDHTINNLANIQENVEASNSRIKDTDFAKETTQMTKNQILQQAGTSILAQAKQLPNSAVTLLQ
jgi:flagellin